MLHANIKQGDEIAPDTGPGSEDAAPGEDRRHSERYVTVLKVGRAVVDGHDQLCLVRNMSRDGARIDLCSEVHKDQKIMIELRSDKVVTGTVRWVGDQAAGIQFDDPVEVSDLLQGRSGRSVLRKLPRAPRFLADARVHLEHEKGVAKGTITGSLVNISLHGLCMESHDIARADEHVLARVEGLPPRKARIRWTGRGMIGLHFDMPMSFSDLARWLESHKHQG